ncbi:MAG: VWA domain-containing protein [Acidobacteriales bacterium]|nr:VWA domain-containing protein [Terriglobales bacterium]
MPQPGHEGGPPNVEDQETIPDSGVPLMPDAPNTEEKGFTIKTQTTFVSVPVTVKDKDDHLVEGLVANEFSVYEDGTAQELRYFTSDPFPLSAAVVIDENISATTMRKINQTLPAITGAFSQYDEVALYFFSNTVKSASEFRGADDDFTVTLRRKKSTGRRVSVPIVSGPLASGPTINGRAVDPNQPRVITPTRESHVLNDALLRAVRDLSKRDKSRRRVIFIISDGMEEGSTASYEEVRKQLLTHQISVYALGVDSAAIPVYDKLSRIRMPGLKRGNLLPKYVSATGGQMIAELDKDAIERAYARLTGDARNQYTLGYYTKATASTSYRSIEVRVKRPSLKVISRDGYFPLPQALNR